ncbi:MAG: tryptophan 7-halogenase [Methylococcaceae bacterium]|nr:tryptophan 7-halogenase [Methylococcaceae bacterium]
MKDFEYDVIIAGAGPAGSTAATLLADYGYRTLMIEAGRHPRFHIGESMLPASEPVMKRLGIDWGAGNQIKQGAEFIQEASEQRLLISFGGNRGTYQVERSRFDQTIYENALAKGVEAHEHEKVLNFMTSDSSVFVESDQGHYTGRYFIDATGRSALSGRKQHSIYKIHEFGRYALFRHYRLAGSELADTLFETGNIQVILVDIGWLWAIPLFGRRLSVGLVVNGHPPFTLKGERLFQYYVNMSSLLANLMKNAMAINDLKTEADFSYLNLNRCGRRFVSCGDAAGFLDPVFSSGFFFAVKTAEMAADRIHRAFLEGREADPALHDDDNRVYSRGFQTMYALIYRFYHSSMIENIVFEADRHQRIKQEITTLLSGDLWDENNLFQQGLLNGRRAFPKKFIQLGVCNERLLAERNSGSL